MTFVKVDFEGGCCKDRRVGRLQGVQGFATGIGSGEHAMDRGDAERRGHTDGNRGAILARTDPGGETSWRCMEGGRRTDA